MTALVIQTQSQFKLEQQVFLFSKCKVRSPASMINTGDKMEKEDTYRTCSSSKKIRISKSNELRQDCHLVLLPSNRRLSVTFFLNMRYITCL